MANCRFSLYGKNLGNSRGVTSITVDGVSTASNPYLEGVIVPRTIGVEASYKF